jgi:hypothetical protein
MTLAWPINKEIFMELNLNNDYLKVLPEVRAISIFESVSYNLFDMDVLGPSQREYLISKVAKLGFVQKTGKWLVAPDGTKIYFPAQKLFNRNFKSFILENQDEHTWMALTPTQAAFLLLKEPKASDEDLLQLMQTQPFNLHRLGIAVEHEPFFSRFLSLKPELERLYERAQVMLKNKLRLDKVRRT